MTQATDSFLDHSTGSIIPSQYNDLVRRRLAGFEDERHLLWAVLQDAIDNYLANMRCATTKQRDEFEEVCGWFRPPEDQPCKLFSIETICDLLEIDAPVLLKGIESIRKREISANMSPSHAPQAAVRPARMAA